MKDWYQDILSNEPTVDAKRLQSFLKNFKKPDIQPSWMFKDQMKKRLNKKMQEKKRQEEVSMLATIPFFVKWRFGLTGFAIATCGFLFIFLLTFFSDFFGTQIVVPSKYMKVESFSLPVQNTVLPETNGILAKQSLLEFDAAEMAGTNESAENVGYLYDGKKYPKVAREMPVYRRGTLLTNQDTLIKQLSKVNVGGLSLKNFNLGSLEHLSLDTAGTTGYIVSLYGERALLTISDKRIKAETEIDERNPPSIKQLKKNIEHILKSRNLPLEGYGKMTLTEGGYVPHTILVFMPQLLNSYPVWDPLTDKQLGIHGRYTVWKNQLALDNIDMAQYEYTNYPTLPKEDILQDFTLGVKKLDAPEVVYLMKNIDDETYYVPGLRFVVDEHTSLFTELVDVK